VRNQPYYDDLEKLVLRSLRTCVVFVGSGLSTGQYPSWPDLIGDLCEACGLPEDAATARAVTDADLLARLADAAHDRGGETYPSKKLDEIFGRRVTHTRAAYGLLMRLAFASYVTTNFDPLLGYESMKPEHNVRGVRALPALNASELTTRCGDGAAGGPRIIRDENSSWTLSQKDANARIFRCDYIKGQEVEIGSRHGLPGLPGMPKTTSKER
jgi:hypothetical protein